MTMAVDERNLDPRLTKARRPGFGIGLLKGLAVTFRALFRRNEVIQYPDEKQDLSPRTRGVIALKEENCTVCMLCGRECPDWCIYIDSHKETLPPKREGGRPRKRNVLDRFAIDYALCMYCGICVEVCPYDALFWSREFEYSEYDIRELTHEKERLSDWMATVLPPPPLEEGAEVPGMPVTAAAAPPEAPPTSAGASGARPPTTTASAVETRPEQAAEAPTAGSVAQQAAGASREEEAPDEAPPEAPAEMTAEAKEMGVPDRPAETTPPAAAAEEKAPAAGEKTPSPEDVARLQETPGPNVEVPAEAPRPSALAPTEDPEAVYKEVLQEQLDKGSSPQVAEARAKVARVKAERGIKRGPTPVHVDSPVPSAPVEGAQAEPEPGGAPEATEPQPPQGPVAPGSETADDSDDGDQLG